MPKRHASYMQNKRDSIVDAAVRCLARTGVDGFSTTAVCEEASISMGALYTHFENRDAILVAIVQKLSEKKTGRFRFSTARDFKKSIDDAVAEIESPAGDLISRVEYMLVEVSVGSKEVQDALAKIGHRNDLHSSLEVLRDRGELRPGVSAATAAAAIMTYFGGLMLVRQTHRNNFAESRRAMKLLVRAILKE